MGSNEQSYAVSESVGRCSEEHSRRSYIPFSADRSLTPNNIVIYDCGDDRKNLNDTARPYIKQYNSKQKRQDRKKDYEDDYVGALEDGRACYGRGDKKEKPFHHDVIQIGNRNELGITDSDFDVRYWRHLKQDGKLKEASEYVKAHLNKDPKVEEAIQILRDVAVEIQNGKYSNILVHGLIIHMDEPNGTPHLDFRYTVFTDKEKMGLPWRVSDHKGLAQMGFVTKSKRINGQDSPEMLTAIQKFRESVKTLVEEKMNEHGWKRKYLNEHRKHLSTAEYEAECLLNNAEQKAKETMDEASDLYDEYMEEIDVRRRRLEKEKREFEETRKNLSGFLSSDVGEKAYREYAAEQRAITAVDIVPTHKKKHAGKISIAKPELSQELQRIDKLNAILPYENIFESEEDEFDEFTDDEMDDVSD